MPNPKPTQTQDFVEKQFKPKGDEPLGKVIGVRFPMVIDNLLQQLPDKTDFIRSAVAEKLQFEGRLQAMPKYKCPECGSTNTSKDKSALGQDTGDRVCLGCKYEGWHSEFTENRPDQEFTQQTSE